MKMRKGTRKQFARPWIFGLHIYTAASCIAVLAFGLSASLAQDVIKLGSLYPLSGAFEVEGKEANQGVVIAAEEINKAGGIKSMGGAKVAVVEEDNGGNAERATKMATRMAQEGVVVFLGTMSSGLSLAIQPVSERSQIPFMVTSSTDPEITNRKLPYTFRAHAHVGFFVDGAVAALKGLSEATGKPIKRVAHLRLELSAYKAISELFEKKLADAGMELVSVVSAPFSATDFSTQVTQLKQAKPDVLIVSALLSHTLEIFKAMDAQKFRPPLTIGVASALADPGFVKAFPKLSENIADIGYWYNPTSPAWKKFSAAYETKYGSVPTTHAANAYQGAIIVLDALERSGSGAGPKLRDALATTSLVENLLPQKGPITFGSDGQNPGIEAPLTQLQGGQSQIIYPSSYGGPKAVFPDPLATYQLGSK